jgi:hypothetical protein
MTQKNQNLNRPSKDLESWIKHLEQEFLKQARRFGAKWQQTATLVLGQMRKSAEDFKSWCWEKPNRISIQKYTGDLPKELTYWEALKERLLIVWADEKFWLLIRKGLKYPPSPHTVDDYIYSFLLHRYHLAIPIPASVWCEMVLRPAERAYLFDLLVVSAPKYFWIQSRDPKNDLPAKWRTELSSEKLGALLNKYVQNPVQDWRPSLVLEGYPTEVLEWLRFAVNRLADDIAYVTRNPERFDARRAPPVAHRLRSLSEVKAIEEMVERLRYDGQVSDGTLAKQSLGRITAAGRKLAREARLLAHYRDCLPVKFYRRRGDKNAPTSPS